MSAARLYMGRLPPNVTKRDVEDHFSGFRIKDIRLMGNFGFLSFENHRDAEDAVRDFAGRDFMGENIILEPPRESRRRDTYNGRAGPDEVPRNGQGRKGVRVSVIGIPHSTSWQDLKDYGRIGNANVLFADVDKNNPGNGIIEFGSLADAEEAISRLSGVDINNTPVKLEIAPTDDNTVDLRPPRDGDFPRPRFDDRGDRQRFEERRDARGADWGPPRRDNDRDERDRLRNYRRDRSPPRRRMEEDRYRARR